jgi:hypothetical protein
MAMIFKPPAARTMAARVATVANPAKMRELTERAGAACASIMAPTLAFAQGAIIGAV